MDGILEKMQRHKKASVRVSCLHAVERNIVGQTREGLEWCGCDMDGKSVKAQRWKKGSVRGAWYSKAASRCGNASKKLQLRIQNIGGNRLIKREVSKWRTER